MVLSLSANTVIFLRKRMFSVTLLKTQLIQNKIFIILSLIIPGCYGHAGLFTHYTRGHEKNMLFLQHNILTLSYDVLI